MAPCQKTPNLKSQVTKNYVRMAVWRFFELNTQSSVYAFGLTFLLLFFVLPAAAVVPVFSGGMGADASPPMASVQIDTDDTTDEVTVQVIGLNNADHVVVRSSAEETETLDTPGESRTMAGSVSVIAVSGEKRFTLQGISPAATQDSPLFLVEADDGWVEERSDNFSNSTSE